MRIHVFIAQVLLLQNNTFSMLLEEEIKRFTAKRETALVLKVI